MCCLVPLHPPLDYPVLCAALGAAQVRRAVPLAPYTTFKIGGPADYFYEAPDAEALAAAVTLARAEAIPYFVLGLGANILVGDGGFRGLVIRNVARGITVEAGTHRVTAESGAIVYPDLIEATVSGGLSGLEHYVGIPSTVGGALWQNLHFLSPPPERARTVFIAEVFQHAALLTAEGHRRTVEGAYFNFGYDTSILHHRRDIVLSATFQLTPADEAQMRTVMAANLEWRQARHPPLDAEPSAGSIFKKIEGIGAGRLIDQCGLKGTRIGGAEITHRHANIIVNRGNATAADVRALIDLMQTTVAREMGYTLEPEIEFVGTFT